MAKGEKVYYRPLAEWLTKEKGYFCGGIQDIKPYIETGIKGQIIDVAGIKNIGSQYFDQIETIAVEVRNLPRATKRDMQDAYGYANLTHRCYLATTAKLAKDDLDFAGRLGLGIIEIKDKDDFLEVVEAKYHEPNHADLLRFLMTLWIGQCTLCQCYFHAWDTSVFNDSSRGLSYAELKRIRQFDFYAKNPKRKDSPFGALQNNEVDRDLTIYRYLCMNCISDLQNKLSKWATKIAQK